MVSPRPPASPRRPVRAFLRFGLVLPTVQVSVLVEDGQAGEVPLLLSKARPGGQVGAHQEATQDVPGKRQREKESERGRVTER